MLKSMTAYGRNSQESSFGSFSVEIQSVNRKFLEINLLLPKEFFHLEEIIKKWVSSKISRGQVTVKISADFKAQSPLVIKPNLPLAKQLKSAWEQMTKELEIERVFDMELLMSQEGIFLYQIDEEKEKLFVEVLEVAFDKAMERFLEMRSAEGALLQKDIETRIEKLENYINEIESFTPNAVNKYRTKLMQRLQELFSGISPENEEKILREVAIFAEKVDITEEIIRFKTHLIQFKNFLSSEKTALGKTIEFLLQEINREVNTLSSKSSEIGITQRAIEMKSELEKIREQIQNIE